MASEKKVPSRMQFHDESVSEVDVSVRSEASDDYQSCTHEETEESNQYPESPDQAAKLPARDHSGSTDADESLTTSENDASSREPEAGNQSQDPRTELERVVSRILKTTNGRDLLYLDGFYYVKDKTRNSVTYWECQKRRHDRNARTYCAGRAVTTLSANGTHKPRKITKHSHMPDPMKAEDHKLRQYLKEEGKVNLAAPSRVVSNAGSKVSNATQARFSKNAQRQVVKRARATSGADPKSIDLLSIPENLRLTLDGDKFYYGCVKTKRGDRAFLFTTEGDLRRMSQARYWSADGTFGFSQLLSQLYTVHCSVAPNHDSTVPALYVLMTSKSEDLYVAVLESVLTIANEKKIELNAKRIYTDFERAQLNAFKRVFHKVRRSTCFFHFAQALWRNIEEKCEVKVSNNQTLYRHYCRVKALAFVPVKDIPAAFKELEKQTPPELQRWMKYVAEIYVRGRVHPITGGKIPPMYEPQIWSVYANVKGGLPRDTNNHESWHARFARQGFKKSKIIPLIDALRLEQKANQGKVCEILAGLKPVNINTIEHNNKLLDVVRDYKKVSILDYLDAIDSHLH